MNIGLSDSYLVHESLWKDLNKAPPPPFTTQTHIYHKPNYLNSLILTEQCVDFSILILLPDI